MSKPGISVIDVQGGADHRRLPIDKVGIKAIRHPIVIEDNGRAQTTVATFNMYVSLAHHQRGTHMSRFVEILNTRTRALSVGNFADLLRDVARTLHADDAYLDIGFPFFVNKHAPVSGVASLLDYDVTLRGEYRRGAASTTLQVVVPVTSLCPCSKQISDYGAHNQRSHVTVAVRTQDTVDTVLWIEELITLVEQEASCEIYGLIKRPDEKFITERAYDNPKFVEDMVRDVAARLNGDARIAAYAVESENFESIHNHSAYARIERDKDTQP